eukprot:tig00000246_g21513.t1
MENSKEEMRDGQRGKESLVPAPAPAAADPDRSLELDESATKALQELEEEQCIPLVGVFFQGFDKRVEPWARVPFFNMFFAMTNTASNRVGLDEVRKQVEVVALMAALAISSTISLSTAVDFNELREADIRLATAPYALQGELVAPSTDLSNSILISLSLNTIVIVSATLFFPLYVYFIGPAVTINASFFLISVIFTCRALARVLAIKFPDYAIEQQGTSDLIFNWSSNSGIIWLGGAVIIPVTLFVFWALVSQVRVAGALPSISAQGELELTGRIIRLQFVYHNISYRTAGEQAALKKQSARVVPVTDSHALMCKVGSAVGAGLGTRGFLTGSEKSRSFFGACVLPAYVLGRSASASSRFFVSAAHAEVPKNPEKARIVIVGGVAGGATASARARRVNEKAEITILERGGYVSFANCGLPYYLSGDIASRDKLLLQNPQGFKDRYNVDVKVRTEVVRIDRARKVVVARNVDTGAESELPYDRLVLSQGAAPIVPDLPGATAAHVFTIRDLDDTDRIQAFLNKNTAKTAVIVGGGFIGVEMAEAMVARGLRTTLLERGAGIMRGVLDAEFSDLCTRVLQKHGVTVLANSGIASVDEGKKTVGLADGRELPADLVIMAVGVRPEVALAKAAGLEVGATGGVAVNELMQTSDPDIFAVGDMAEVTHRVTGRKVRVPLGGPANRQGRVAGNNAAGGRMAYPGTLGSWVVKLFDHTAGATGLTEDTARAAGLSFGAVTVHPNHHAGYYPGAEPLQLKLIFEKGTGRVLGCEAFGKAGVDKRVDVVAAAIAGRISLEELEDIDLSYAPPYSSANDPVNMAAFVASNASTGYSPAITPAELVPLLNDPAVAIVDVRGAGEWEAGHLAASNVRNVPLPELRARLGEIPRDRRVVVHCQVGMRGHIALRCLVQNGFSDVRNVTGGFKSMAQHAALPVAKGK